MKIIAFYLPQFHEIKENNEWWGKGFTEWTNVKAAKPIFDGHYQPKVPLNNNYYNLLDDDVKIWQASIAKKYGIYGFCYYHYWFDGKMLLEKPMEQMLQNKKIDFPFCICWANEPWSKRWVGNEKKILINQFYGEEKSWSKHFNYLKKFFHDERYIKEDNKPLLLIYRPHVIPCINEMIELWNNLAIQEGFSGIKILGCMQDLINYKENYNTKDNRFKNIDNIVEWEPQFAKNIIKRENTKNNILIYFIKKIRRKIYKIFEDILGHPVDTFSIIKLLKPNKKIYSWEEIYKKIVILKPFDNKFIPSVFVRFDNTPRYGEKAEISIGDTPELFKKYLKLQIKNTKKNYHQDKLFLYAWNEWAEGGMLEPDEKYQYQYLEALRDALIETGEFEK